MLSAILCLPSEKIHTPRWHYPLEHQMNACSPIKLYIAYVSERVYKYLLQKRLCHCFYVHCVDDILGRFTIIRNQIARVDSLTNLTKRWVFRFLLNVSISSHNLISFGKQFYAIGPYTANARLPKVSCVNFGTFRTRSTLDLIEYLLLFDGVIISWM